MIKLFKRRLISLYHNVKPYLPVRKGLYICRLLKTFSIKALDCKGLLYSIAWASHQLDGRIRSKFSTIRKVLVAALPHTHMILPVRTRKQYYRCLRDLLTTLVLTCNTGAVYCGIIKNSNQDYQLKTGRLRDPEIIWYVLSEILTCQCNWHKI
jgi:hypothetical protein